MFVLNDENVTVTKDDSDGKIEARVVSSEESDDHFRGRICAIWPNLLLFLKRKLGNAELAKNGDGSLFELRFKDGKFTLITQPWAAETLKLPSKITFCASCPEMVMHQITALMKKPRTKTKH